VVITSPDSGAGCTWVTARIAEVLAGRIAGSVCIVDANFKNPGMHQQFGLDNRHGLREALIQTDPIRTFARPLGLPNLFMIPAGTGEGDETNLLASDRMRLRIGELRSEFDFVLIDSPAMSAAPEVIGMGALCDGVVLVLKAHSSRKQTARQAVAELQGGSAKVLGAVLNQRTFPIPEKLYKKL
jgi:Mrp family chromosome partitioning ATPase